MSWPESSTRRPALRRELAGQAAEVVRLAAGSLRAQAEALKHRCFKREWRY